MKQITMDYETYITELRAAKLSGFNLIKDLDSDLAIVNAILIRAYFTDNDLGKCRGIISKALNALYDIEGEAK